MPCIEEGKRLSLNFSQIKEMLSRKGDVALHRQVLILAGDELWQNDSLQEILLGYEDDPLWVGEHGPEMFPFISIKKAHNWLGNEKQVVIFDAAKGVGGT